MTTLSLAPLTRRVPAASMPPITSKNHRLGVLSHREEKPSLMAAKLKVRPAQGEPFDVEIGNTATIGRSRENTISLTHKSACLAAARGNPVP